MTIDRAIQILDPDHREWISVTDRLPKAFEPVIVCRPDGKVEPGQKDIGDWWRVYGTRTKRVTHWMPMPEPPEGDSPCADCSGITYRQTNSGKIIPADSICARRDRMDQLARVTAELDAAVADLALVADCRTCGNRTGWCDNPDACKGYEWRGLAEMPGAKSDA